MLLSCAEPKNFFLASKANFVCPVRAIRYAGSFIPLWRVFHPLMRIDEHICSKLGFLKNCKYNFITNMRSFSRSWQPYAPTLGMFRGLFSRLLRADSIQSTHFPYTFPKL